MDPISIIGLAGSIGGLIDITSRSIFALLDLRGRYSDFGFKITQIVGHLLTFKAALKKIKDLIEIGHDDILRKSETYVFPMNDEQLVCDLNESIICCESLIKRRDDQLSQFQLASPSQSSGPSNVWTKVKFLLEESDIDGYQVMLNNHINALNLLFTVTRWFVLPSFFDSNLSSKRSANKSVVYSVKQRWNGEICYGWSQADVSLSKSEMTHHLSCSKEIKSRL